MAVQFSTAVRNARLAAIWSTIGPSAKLVLYTGAMPASTAAAATGTVLATLTLPVVEEAAPSGGSAVIAAPWTGNASAAGTAGYFRVYDSALASCHMQGTVGQTSVSTGDMMFDNAVLASSQAIQIPTFTETDGNA